MRRLLRLSANLYPRRWRDRYGEEFLALLEDAEPRWSDVWNVIGESLLARSKDMNARKAIFIGTLVTLLIVLAIVARTPATYTSTSVIRIIPPRINADGIGPKDVMGKVAQEVLSRNTISGIIKVYHLYEREVAEGREKDAIVSFGKNVKIDCFKSPNNAAGQECSAMQVSYAAPNPVVAQKVTRDLMAKLIDANISQRVNTPHPLGATLEVLELPSLPSRVDQYWNFQSPHAQGGLVGFAIGLSFAFAVLFGWRRFANPARGPDDSIVGL